jgi:hypothetical protein
VLGGLSQATIAQLRYETVTITEAEPAELMGFS